MVDIQEVAGNLTAYLGVTAEGKELWMQRKPGEPLRHICFKGGGKLPECLEGGFSSIQVATTAVENYIQAKADAGKKVKKGRSTASK
jgi:hypothetical protein